MQKISDVGLRFIANEEGFVPHVYIDFAGVPTIGYGHALRPGERFTTLTEPEGLELLREDVGTAEGQVRAAVHVELTQGQFDALVSFTFNLGGGALASSTLLKKLNAGDYDCAAAEFARWVKYGSPPKTSPTLVGRRKREVAMFMADDAKPARERTENLQPGVGVITLSRGGGGEPPDAA